MDWSITCIDVQLHYLKKKNVHLNSINSDGSMDVCVCVCDLSNSGDTTGVNSIQKRTSSSTSSAGGDRQRQQKRGDLMADSHDAT